MQFKIDREILLKPLQRVNSVIGSRPSLPILNNLLLEVKDGNLKITGTDTEVELVANIALTEHYIDGSITVPSRKFVDIVKNLPASSLINCELKEERLIVTAGKSRFTLVTLPPNGFPNIENIDVKSDIMINQKQLNDLISSVQFSMASQDIRYYLNGMLFSIEKSSFKTVATDGHRLAVAELKLDKNNEINEDIEVIVPRKGVLELLKSLDQEDDDILIQIGENNLIAEVNSYTFTCKLIDHRFPDYKRVIPQNGDKVMIASKENLRHAFSRVAILSNEKFRGVSLQLENNKLTISATNPEQEKAVEELDVDYQYDELEIGFNVHYVQAVLNALKTQSVKMTMHDSNSSTILEDANLQEEDPIKVIYIIMPMRL